MKNFPVKLGEGGRGVIPAELVLLTRKQAIQYVQEQMAKYEIGDRVLSQELIDDRRRETQK
ncbi:hypothetical protein PAT3040_05189 [Paenibacillus agaridevorans]|uniref:Uncharacterized protein n=1 Tax=Paenibacillus agaridevorans TaxID=171404 RepID=A0A2R5EUT4_9BACL|nr:hypothetical protein [Paenibacillus agaridevorans]GBG10456.1 hypothetical protein PAT3040_05189 [Paenibacillus agaridevorans]